MGVIGISHRLNPSGRTMALGSTQPLTEMSAKFAGENLATFMYQLSRNAGRPNLLAPVRAFTHLARISTVFIYFPCSGIYRYVSF